MLKFRLPGKTLLLATLCASTFGCADSTTTSTQTNPPVDGDVTVSAKKPATPEDPASSTTVDVDRENGSVTIDHTNTGINARDRDGVTKTPIDQNENKADIKITADIRSRVVDTEMSVDAQNVKIITQDGKVTLRGPVHSAAEKSKIEQIAQDVAGKDNVASQLEIDAN